MEFWKDPQTNKVFGVTCKGYTFILEIRPQLKNLEGRFAQNGIQVPKSGRWIVLPNGLIDADHVLEIAKAKTVLPTLFIGTRRDQPIVQDR